MTSPYTTSTTPLSSSERDRQSLLSLLQGTEGLDWSTTHSGWDASTTEPSSVCDWEGISCRISLEDPSKHYIVGINLPNSGLSGTLPPELGRLEHLQEINLRGNLIRGSIPQEITTLKELTLVDLTECQLEGTLPQHWSSDKLDKLLLGQNGIGGVFFNDASSPHLLSISEINLEQNKLDGTIDGKIIKSMQKLETLSLSQNNLSGLLPGKAIGSLSTLKYLYLDSNHFVGSLPSSIAQQNKANLEELWLQDNALSGTIPASFVRLDKLHDFFIDGNKFTGLPEEICSPSLNEDFFVSQSSANTNTEKTYCDSIACPPGSISLEGMHPCTKCAGAPDVARMKNPYLGQKGTSCRDWSQRDILKMFHEGASKNGPWTKDGNGVHDWMNDEMDMCEFTGVTCDGHGNVVKIGLRGRNLSGTISESIGFLQFLEELDVSENDLTGFLPSDLRWTDLTKLDISGNRIRGVVPPLLCLMEELNGNGDNNVFHCDRLACPVGTYNDKGRYYEGKNEGKCLPCYDETPFIGQTSCIHKNNPHTIIGQILDGSQVVIGSAEGFSAKHGIIIGSVVGSLLFCCCLLRRRGQRRKRKQNEIERCAILNHENNLPLRKYRDDDSSSSSDDSGSSSSDDSDDSDDDDPQVELPVRIGNGNRYNGHYKDDAKQIYTPNSDDALDHSVSSSRSAPLQVTDFLREQKRGSITKQSPLTKVMKKHVPRARDAIMSTVESVSNGVSGRPSRKKYESLDADQYSTIDFGSNDDVEMAEHHHEISTDPPDKQRRRSSGGPRQYSDLLDVPTFE